MIESMYAHKKVVATPEEIENLTELNRALNSRINELTQEKAEAIKTANYWKEKFLALEATLNKDMAD